MQPFCRFELFGLWSTLALTFKESNSERMNRMFQRSAMLYGIPAIEVCVCVCVCVFDV